MANHPNREWRRHMELAADEWLKTGLAAVLIIHPFTRITSRLRQAYLAGYEAGRKSKK